MSQLNTYSLNVYEIILTASPSSVRSSFCYSSTGFLTTAASDRHHESVMEGGLYLPGFGFFNLLAPGFIIFCCAVTLFLSDSLFWRSQRALGMRAKSDSKCFSDVSSDWTSPFSYRPLVDPEQLEGNWKVNVGLLSASAKAVENVLK